MENIKELYKAGQEDLAVLLMLGQHNCQYRIFGTIGTYLTDGMEVKSYVETFMLIEGAKDIKSFGNIKLRHQSNPQIKYKSFFFNINEKYIFDELLQQKQENSHRFAKVVELFNPIYFKL